VYACGGGACGTGTMMESQSCTRATDGSTCDDGVFRTCGDYCFGGTCQSGEFCPIGCVCDPAGFCYDDGSSRCLTP
jgi:hypothetical protein